MAGPTTIAGALARDAAGRYFGHLWDLISGKGVAQRAVNVDAGNGVGDSSVVLYDHVGAPLLTTAAALADATTNPTVGRLGTHVLVYNGATWERLRSAVAFGSDNSGTGVLAATPIIHNSADGLYRRTASASTVLDANPGNSNQASSLMLYNGATFDRARNNTSQTVFASAARTTTTTGTTVKSYNARAAIACLQVTVASGTGGLTFKWILDPPQGGSLAYANVSPTAITTTGVFMFVLGMDATTALGHTGVSQVCNFPLPPTIGVQIIVGDASSYTYSVGMSLLV